MTTQKRGRKPNQNKQQSTKVVEGIVSDISNNPTQTYQEESKSSQSASTELTEVCNETTEENSITEDIKFTTSMTTKVIKTATFDQLVDQILETCNNNESVSIDTTYRLLVDGYPFSIRLNVGEERKEPLPTIEGSVMLKENNSATFLEKLIEYGNQGYKRTKNYNFGRYPFTFMLSNGS